MSRFKPSYPYCTQVELYVPTYTTAVGVPKKVMPKKPTDVINVSWKSYGGTETTINDVYSVIDTATVETWYRPDIKSDCRLKHDGMFYEILGKPEDIEMRHQFIRMKVQAVEGGA